MLATGVVIVAAGLPVSVCAAQYGSDMGLRGAGFEFDRMTPRIQDALAHTRPA